MDDKLTATIEQRRSGARVIKLAGVLDEHNELAQLVDRVGTGNALINLAGVERINSRGVRDWVSWLEQLDAKGIKPMLIACSPAVVARLNTIKGFAGPCVVKSLHLPYRCAACSRDKLLLVNVADLGTDPRAPVCPCDACNEPMKFADEAGTYFAFLSQLQAKKQMVKTRARSDFARGSTSSLTDEHIARVSRPELVSRPSSRPSLSAFQLPSRVTNHEITVVIPSNERPWLIAIVGLLLCMIGVLSYLLLS